MERNYHKKIQISLALGCATKNQQHQDIQATIAEAENNMYKRKLLERKSISGSILLSLEAALSEKSYETKEHTERIKKLALKLGMKLKLHDDKLNELALLASLHDIGKVAIPESVVLKNGKLSESEWELVKKHPEIGHNIAESSPQISHIADAILSCHEHWDGSGYPQGLKGDEIPVISRIIHIVDAYDVMRSGRPYKKAMSKKSAIEELKRYSGTQFDSKITDEFIALIEKP